MHVKGTILGVDTAGTTTFVAVAKVAAISFPGKTRGVAETTHMTSPDSYREWVKGFKVGDDATVRLRFTKAQYAALDTAFEDDTDTVPNWEFKFPLVASESNASKMTFKAIIMSLGVAEKSVDGEDVWETEMTLKPTGKPVFASGS
jgi:hypothetical protein